MRLRQKKGDACFNKKSCTPEPSGNSGQPDGPQHPAESGGENLEVVLKPLLGKPGGL